MNFRFASVGIVGKCWNTIPLEQQGDFNLWAVGFEEFLLCEFIPCWNRLHGDAFFIHEDRSIDECVDVILKFWGAR